MLVKIYSRDGGEKAPMVFQARFDEFAEDDVYFPGSKSVGATLEDLDVGVNCLHGLLKFGEYKGPLIAAGVAGAGNPAPRLVLIPKCEPVKELFRRFWML